MPMEINTFLVPRERNGGKASDRRSSFCGRIRFERPRFSDEQASTQLSYHHRGQTPIIASYWLLLDGDSQWERVGLGC